MTYESNIFLLHTCSEDSSVAFLTRQLDNSGTAIAKKFGITCLPRGSKIEIHIIGLSQFSEMKNMLFKSCNTNDIVAFSAESVYALSYPEIAMHYTIDSFCKVILHECIHAIQLMTTKVPTSHAVWLYEAVACYLSEQYQAFPKEEPIPTWRNVKNDFYSINHCYALAYLIGKMLIKQNDSADIVSLLSDLPRCETLCEKYLSSI